MSNNRSWLSLAAGMSFEAVVAAFSMNSMLDCPEQSHTSPANTSLYNKVVFPSVTVKVYGPPADRGANVTCQCPSLPARAVFFCPAMLTFTLASALAIPLICKGRSR